METLPHLIRHSLGVSRDRAVGERLGTPEWRYLSARALLDRVDALACAIRAAGVEPGDRVVLLANNCIDWIAVDFAILCAGAVAVPVFATLALDQVDFIFEDSEAKLAFVETESGAARIAVGCSHVPPRVVCFEGEGRDSLRTFEAEGDAVARRDRAAAASLADASAPDGLAVLIYTSGTTGTPKGVMLTHRNLVRNSTDAFAYGMTEVVAGDAVLSVLPFAHIYEHTNVLGFIQYGCSLHVTRPDYLLDDLRSVRPRTMAIVPRILERVLAGTIATAKAEGGVGARVVPWSLRVGRDYMRAKTSARAPGLALRAQYALARRIVFGPLRERLGLDRAQFLVSGSAPLHRDIGLTFAAIGVPICEGYGLTETSPVIAVNRLDSVRYGSVGKPITGVSVKIADDGEILVKGPNVMRGYYRLPGEHPFTEDGWLRTGDTGRLDDDGFLYITGRKKELLKTSAGKYVVSGRVEAALKRSPYIAQAMVVGDGRPFPIALIAPHWELLRGELGLAANVATPTLAVRADARDLVRREARQATADLAPFEQIRRVALLPADLSVEAGELSPTLKIKRRVVEAKYRDSIDAAYAEETPPTN